MNVIIKAIILVLKKLDIDLETRITRTLSDSLAVWLANIKMGLAEIGKFLYTFNEPA
jgi:hypothetical protein